MKYYNVLSADDAYSWVRWTDYRKHFTLDKANAFFIGVMLDQGYKAEKAWSRGRHLVDTRFKGKRGFWEGIRRTDPQRVARICKSGYGGSSYAPRYIHNKFPRWLRAAAITMRDEYDDDPRKIWAVSPNNVDIIYDRLIEFDGVGDALAKMGRNILVRNYGVAGGKLSHASMAVKPDVQVCRVLTRTGITSRGSPAAVRRELETLPLRRPVDFDAAAWVIGREFCTPEPKCGQCPLRRVCKRRLTH